MATKKATKNKDIELKEKEINIAEPTNAPPEKEKVTEKPRRIKKGTKITLISVGAALLVLALLVTMFVAPWIPYINETVEPENREGESVSIEVGKTATLNTSYKTAEQTISFVSSCPEAVSVDASGEITAIAEYPTTIRATVADPPPEEPELGFFEKIRSELRILFGIDERIDYSSSTPVVVYIYDYEIIVTAPANEMDGVIEMSVGQSASFELDLEESEVAKYSSEDANIVSITDDTINAVAEGETKITITYGIEVVIDGVITFMATRADVYSIKINANKSGGSSDKSVVIDPANPGGGGGNSGGGNNGGNGGGSTRPYPLPSQAEVEAFVAQANAYGQSLGMGINSSLTIGNAGYNAPSSTWMLPWSTVKSDVYWQIEFVYSLLSSEQGWYDGAPAFKVVWQFYNGEYDIYVLYG